MYDPKTGKYTAYQTCFGSHHLQFGYDANETLWASTGGGGGNVGWINTKMLDETGDIEKSQGWTALVLDTNGNGQRDEYTEPGKPQEPGKDMRIGATFYAVMPSPTDGSVWGTLRGSPGAIVRIDPTKNPHKSLAEQYNVPLPGFGPRGGDIDKQGRVWVSLASGHMGVFDRRLCKGPLNGPKATGDHCPEGWAFHQYPGPGFKGIGENSAEFELLLVGRPAQHLRARRRHSDVDRQPDGRARRPRQRRQDGLDPRAVSARLLRQGLRRPHRRSERRLEGPRPVGRQRRSHAMADRRRQRHQAAGGALPTAT